MSVKSFLDNLFGRKKQITAGDVVKDLAESYAAIEAAGEADPVEATIEKIKEIIRESDDKNRTAEHILRAALDEEKMPNIVPQQLSVEISQSSLVSDSVIPAAIEGTDSNVPDELINNIIEEGDVDPSERFRLLRSVDDEGILEDRLKSEIELLYRTCKDKKDSDVASRLTKLKSIADDGAGDIDFLPFAEHIISKKMAENFYNDLQRTSMTFAFSQVVPYSVMFADDIPSMVEKEFGLIEEQRGPKPGRYRKDEVRRKFLEEMAKTIGRRYKSTRAYVIPRSDQMKAISEEEEKYFTDKIQHYSESEFTKKERRYVTEQIRGVIRSDHTRAMIIIDAIKEMPDIDDGVERVTNLLTNKATIEVLLAMEENGLLKRLTLLPPEKRIQALDMIESAFSKRTKQAEQKTEDPKKPAEPKTLKLTKEGSSELSDR